MSDTILMCSKNWTELLRSELQEADIYRSCILWTKKGFEKAVWIDVLTGEVSPRTMEGECEFFLFFFVSMHTCHCVWKIIDMKLINKNLLQFTLFTLDKISRH